MKTDSKIKEKFLKASEQFIEMQKSLNERTKGVRQNSRKDWIASFLAMTAHQ
jgi:hypothetical protein